MTPFAACLAHTLKYEGGYVDNPKDPGGATNQGVTQGVYDTYRSMVAHTGKQSVKLLTDIERDAIYKSLYWNRVHGDDLPAGLNLAVFDMGVNSGVARASRFLQNLVGAQADGTIGAGTLLKVSQYGDKLKLIDNYQAARLNYLQGLDTFPTFGRGWSARVEECRLAARQMAAGAV